jgi:hypothetical protein
MKVAGWVVSAILALVALVLFGLLCVSVSQLRAANQQITTLKSQVTTAQADAASEKEAADQAQQDLAYQSLPEVPCTLGFGDPGLFSSEHGSVASIENVGSDEAALNIHIERPSDGTSKTIEDFVIEGHQSRDLGEDEGWAFVSGDKITLSEGGHKDETWTMN